jgi:hypothetical protein
MPFSAYEQFLGYDWLHLASQGSKLTAVACVAIGVITIFLELHFFAGFVAIFAGLLLSVWEFPFIFCWFQNFEQWKFYLEESLYFRYEEVKGLACIALSLISFRIGGLLTLTFGLLFLTGLLFLFAAINRRADQMERDNIQIRPNSAPPSFPNVLPMYTAIPTETTSLPNYTSNKPSSTQSQQYSHAHNPSVPQGGNPNSQFGTFN